jgi:hypothetical protein
MLRRIKSELGLGPTYPPIGPPSAEDQKNCDSPISTAWLSQLSADQKVGRHHLEHYCKSQYNDPLDPDSPEWVPFAATNAGDNFYPCCKQLPRGVRQQYDKKRRTLQQETLAHMQVELTDYSRLIAEITNQLEELYDRAMDEKSINNLLLNEMQTKELLKIAQDYVAAIRYCQQSPDDYTQGCLNLGQLHAKLKVRKGAAMTKLKLRSVEMNNILGRVPPAEEKRRNGKIGVMLEGMRWLLWGLKGVIIAGYCLMLLSPLLASFGGGMKVEVTTKQWEDTCAVLTADWQKQQSKVQETQTLVDGAETALKSGLETVKGFATYASDWLPESMVKSVEEATITLPPVVPPLELPPHPGPPVFSFTQGILYSFRDFMVFLSMLGVSIPLVSKFLVLLMMFQVLSRASSWIPGVKSIDFNLFAAVMEAYSTKNWKGVAKLLGKGVAVVGLVVMISYFESFIVTIMKYVVGNCQTFGDGYANTIINELKEGKFLPSGEYAQTISENLMYLADESKALSQRLLYGLQLAKLGNGWWGNFSAACNVMGGLFSLFHTGFLRWFLLGRRGKAKSDEEQLEEAKRMREETEQKFKEFKEASIDMHRTTAYREFALQRQFEAALEHKRPPQAALEHKRPPQAALEHKMPPQAALIDARDHHHSVPRRPQSSLQALPPSSPLHLQSPADWLNEQPKQSRHLTKTTILPQDEKRKPAVTKTSLQSPTDWLRQELPASAVSRVSFPQRGKKRSAALTMDFQERKSTSVVGEEDEDTRATKRAKMDGRRDRLEDTHRMQDDEW